MGKLKEEFGDYDLDDYGIEDNATGKHTTFKGGGPGRVKTQ